MANRVNGCGPVRMTSLCACHVCACMCVYVHVRTEISLQVKEEKCIIRKKSSKKENLKVVKVMLHRGSTGLTTPLPSCSHVIRFSGISFFFGFGMLYYGLSGQIVSQRSQLDQQLRGEQFVL